MTVTVPAQISTQGNVEIGDTVSFIDKFNAFQSELTRFSGEANQMASALNTLIADFTVLVDQSEQQMGLAAAGHSSDLASQGAALLSQMQSLDSAVAQNKTAVDAALSAVNASAAEIATAKEEVVEAQGGALIAAIEDLKPAQHAKLLAEIELSDLRRVTGANF